MLKRKITCIAYETVEDRYKKLPLLKPMSQVAGQMAILMGSYYLAKPYKGKGVLLSNVPKTKPSKTLIIGGGVVGENALINAHGLRGNVVLAEINKERMQELRKKYSGVKIIKSTMPGAYPRTSTIALTTATLPYIMKLANKGLNALKEDKGFMHGLNLFKGKVTHKGVAEAFGMEFFEPKSLL